MGRSHKYMEGESVREMKKKTSLNTEKEIGAIYFGGTPCAISRGFVTQIVDSINFISS